MGLPLRHSLPPILDVAVEPVAAIEAEAWDALALAAAEPHPFYARRPIEAHRASGLGPADLAAVVVRGPGGPEALLPFVLRADIAGLGAAIAQPFLSPYVTASAPLVADGPDLDARLDALVAGLALASGGRCWRWPMLPVESRPGAGLVAAMERAGWQVATVASFERPVLDRRTDHAAFLAGHPHRGRLKDLRRRRRRLAEAGALRFEVATEGTALERALDAFLALEAAGWKGEAGTALASQQDSTRFAHALFRQDALAPEPPAVRADTLRLDGRVIAASLALVAGPTAYLLKTAYDESLRIHAPGLVLEDEIVRALHDAAFADRLDSATLPGSPLESLFPERVRIAEILALPPGGSLLPLERRADLARFELRARAEVKRLIGRR